jgi:flagellar biosynthetic protein FlhB
MSGSAGDRTEAPTAKRKKESRKKGQIAATPELAAWAQLLVATYFVERTIVVGFDTARAALAQLLMLGPESDAADGLAVLGPAFKGSLLAVLPLAFSAVAIAVIGQFAQVGPYFSASLLKPKGERLNVAKGIKRLFSPQSAWQVGKTFVKFLILALAVWEPMTGLVHRMASSNRPPLMACLALIATTAMGVVRRIALLGFVLAGVDYALLKRRTMKNMKMTKQEVKEEGKQAEGDPHVKGALRRRQLEVSRNRMIADVANANVVVVNPTHVAVALRYEQGKGAPRVIAKGAGEVAARIRAAAEEHSVPIVRDVPLARTLHGSCEVGDEIPGDLYEAVARVLAFVMMLGSRARWGGVLELSGAAR